MLEEIKKELINLFGDRVAFHITERTLYSRDMGARPRILTFGLNTVPDAVVQPSNREDLTALLDIAGRHRLPVVPRGAGTSAYGGAVPARGGIVVDFYRLNSVIEVNSREMTVTVEPGIAWQDLELKLRQQNLSLRTYPSSAPSATVGGWVAAGGGAGIGSYEFGFLPDNLVEVELVTPAGIRLLKKDDLDLVYGMNGITGLISRVKISLRPAEEEFPVAASFTTLESLLKAFGKIREKGLELYHAGCQSPLSLRWSAEAVKIQKEKDVVKRFLPESAGPPAQGYQGVFVFSGSRKSQIDRALCEIIEKEGGEILDESRSRQAWEDRFYPLRFKVLGPSLIASEVILPAENVDLLIKKVRGNSGKDLCFEGTVVNRGSQAALLFYRLSNERSWKFTWTYPLALVPVHIAASLGGGPYASGLYLTSAYSVLRRTSEKDNRYSGKERLQKVIEFKKKVDPNRLLNPGKVLPARLERNSPARSIQLLENTANHLITFFRLLDKVSAKPALMKPLVSRTPLGKQPLVQSLIQDMYACTYCGYCRQKCTEFAAFGWESASPRGRFQFLKEYEAGKVRLDERMADMLFNCTTCQRCDHTCQARIPIVEHGDLTIRPALWQEGYVLPSALEGTTENTLARHNPAGHAHEKRPEWITKDMRYRQSGDTGYWAGCTASYGMKNLAENPVRLLNIAGVEPVLFEQDEWCCGCDTMLHGRMDEIRDTVRHNIEAMYRRGINKLIVHCPGCWSSFALFYPVLAKGLGLEWKISVEHITQTLASLLKSSRLKLEKPFEQKVTYHDSCHLGRRGGIYEPPREVLKAVPGLELVEMPHNRVEATCCGRQLMLYTEYGPKPYDQRVLEAQATGAKTLVTNCPGCQVAYMLGVRNTQATVDVTDITDILAQSAGLQRRDAKAITRMVYRARDVFQKPKVKQDEERSRHAFAPHEEVYKELKRR